MRASGAAGILAALALAGLAIHLYRSNDRSSLDGSEWARLSARFVRRAVAARTAPEAPPEPAPVAEPSTDPPARLPVPALAPETADAQREAYEARRRKSVVELQPGRLTVSLALPESSDAAKATLVNLNPTINGWYLLTVDWRDGATTTHHLDNARPGTRDLTLDPEFPWGVTLADTAGKRGCDLWSEAAPLPLRAAAGSGTPHLGLCDDAVTLRLTVPGRRTTMEWATDFLRDNVWGGERITNFIKESFFEDAYLETGEVSAGASGEEAEGPGGPPPASLAERDAEVRIAATELGLTPEAPGTEGGLVAGRWYPSRDVPGVFVSVLRPDLIDPEILTGHRDVVSALDAVEREALVYLVAFDLERYDLGFALGTEHPRVGWSARAPESVRDPALPGPDGFDTLDPMVMTGVVPRAVAPTTVATFTGGFKRDHGAFRVSELATRNHGTHYGFIVSGVILSKLQPELATLFVLDDRSVVMKTWREEDDPLLPRIRFARQNGVPLLEPSAESGATVPGRKVSQWTAGNWSGSADRKLRTVRAGAALTRSDAGTFLIYAYFSSATPSAMVRVFQAYGSEYAMLLDMNALEHTYAAIYRARDGRIEVEHLVRGMEVLDRAAGETVLPRFLGFADNRDFFYVHEKPGPFPGAGGR